MNRFKRILGLGLTVSILGLAGGASLGAAEPSTEKANWDNLKELAQGEEIQVVLNDAKSYPAEVSFKA